MWRSGKGHGLAALLSLISHSGLGSGLAAGHLSDEIASLPGAEGNCTQVTDSGAAGFFRSHIDENERTVSIK